MKMKRFVPYLGIVAAAYFFTLAVAFVNESSVQQTPTKVPTASSTVSIVPSYTVPSITLPNLKEAESPVKETLPPKKVTAPTKNTVSAPVPAAASVPVSTPVSVPVSNAALDASASTLRSALVNIICYAPLGSGFHSISGSGIFIDPKGIILTNAHIAQYFLLADRNVTCTIRSGSPAIDKYGAKPIYIPPAWLYANAKVLTQSTPNGTGQYDFALIAVSKSADRNPLPDSFPSIPLAISPPTSGTPVIIASYGAQFLASSQVLSFLTPTIVFGSIKEIFTFVKNTVDVLAFGGSAAAQEGSSGGGVANAFGELVGTITTSTIEGPTDTRSLTAITASYIRAEYATETGEAIDLLLGQPTSISISNFAQRIPELEAIITAQLN